MSKVTVKTEVSKETYELGDALAGIVESVRVKAAEGLTAGEIAQSLTENVGKIMNAVAGADQLGAEGKEDPGASIMASAIIAGRVAAVLVTGKPALAEVLPF